MQSLHLKTIGIVLFAAFAIEAANFFLLTPPIDVGYESGTPLYIQLIGFQWAILHIVGLRTMSWFEHVAGCGQGNVVGSCGRVDVTVLFLGGYLSTALLLGAITFGIQRLLCQRAA
jgi:hypothetical protein